MYVLTGVLRPDLYLIYYHDMGRAGVSFVFIVCGVMIYGYCTAQSGERLKRLEALREEIFQYAGQDGETEGRMQIAAEYFYQLAERPLNINIASKGDLERLMILTDFQIHSILKYREEHGDILSETELSLLYGFNPETARVAGCFVVFEKGGRGRSSSGNFFKDCYSGLLFKMSRKFVKDGNYSVKTDNGENSNSGYIGTPYYMQLKYKCDYLGKVQAGFTLENDAGERFLSPGKIPAGDFLSFHAAFKEIRAGGFLADIVLGDFSARFAQGLTLWNSFSFGTAASPQGLCKRGVPVLPYTSSDEDNFFRGAAISLRREFKRGEGTGIREIRITTLFSYNGVDANVKGHVYTSILKGGLHNTVSTYNARKAMYESLGGVSVTARFNIFKAGVNWTAYGYNKENGRRVSEYNKYQMYYGTWGNFSADFYAVAGRVRLFGEFAADYGLSCAVLLGAVFNIGNAEIGVLARSYSRSYIAPHANAYSTVSGCCNQTGAVLNAVYPAGKLFKLSANFDFAYYPWQRFNVPYASAMVKGFIKGEYEGERLNGYLKFSGGFFTDRLYSKAGVKGLAKYSVCRNLIIGVRGEIMAVYGQRAGNGSSWIAGNYAGNGSGTGRSADTFGWAGAVDIDYGMAAGRIVFRARAAYFNTPQWNARLYMYENDLPGSYGTVLLYGEGLRGYLMAGVKVFRGCDFYLKSEITGYLKGGGESGLPSPRSGIKSGIRVEF